MGGICPSSYNVKKGSALKSRMDSMSGFELLWKIVTLVVVAVAAHCILRLRNMEDKSEERGKDCWQNIEF